MFTIQTNILHVSCPAHIVNADIISALLHDYIWARLSASEIDDVEKEFENTWHKLKFQCDGVAV